MLFSLLYAVGIVNAFDFIFVIVIVEERRRTEERSRKKVNNATKQINFSVVKKNTHVCRADCWWKSFPSFFFSVESANLYCIFSSWFLLGKIKICIAFIYGTPHARTLVRRNYTKCYIMSNADDYMIVCAPNCNFTTERKITERHKKKRTNNNNTGCYTASNTGKYFWMNYWCLLFRLRDGWMAVRLVLKCTWFEIPIVCS